MFWVFLVAAFSRGRQVRRSRPTEGRVLPGGINTFNGRFPYPLQVAVCRRHRALLLVRPDRPASGAGARPSVQSAE